MHYFFLIIITLSVANAQGEEFFDDQVFFTEQQKRIGGVIRSINYSSNVDSQEGQWGSANIFRLEVSVPEIIGGVLMLHNELRYTYDSLGGDVPVASLFQAPDRAADMDVNISKDTYHSTDNIVDWFYWRYKGVNSTFTIGRQPISLSRGSIWSPVDLFSPFSPFDIDRLYKAGVDSIRLEIYNRDITYSSIIQFGGDGKHAIDTDERHSSFLQRALWSSGKVEVGVSLGYVKQDTLLAIDLFYDFPGIIDLYVEWVRRDMSSYRSDIYGEKWSNSFLLGAMAKTSSKTFVSVEFYRNSLGQNDNKNYATYALSQASAGDPKFGLGSYYLGLSGRLEINPLLFLEGVVINNLSDASSALSLQIRYNLTSNVDIIGGGLVAKGDALDEFVGNSQTYTFMINYYF